MERQIRGGIRYGQGYALSVREAVERVRGTLEEGFCGGSSAECLGLGFGSGHCFNSFEGNFPSVEGIARGKAVHCFHSEQSSVDVRCVRVGNFPKFWQIAVEPCRSLSADVEWIPSHAVRIGGENLESSELCD